MNDRKFYSAGFYLTKKTDRESYMNKELTPPSIYSLSSDICEYFPDLWAYDWNEDLHSELVAIEHKYPSISKLSNQLTKDVNACYDKEIGCPNIFFSIEFARKFYKKYFSQISGIKLLELQISEEYYMDLIEEISYFNDGCEDPPILTFLKLKQEANDGKLLGYDILGYETGDFHSYLDYKIEETIFQKFKTKPNCYGFFDDYQIASCISKDMNNGVIDCEQALFLPWRIQEHELTTTNPHPQQITKKTKISARKSSTYVEHETHGNNRNQKFTS